MQKRIVREVDARYEVGRAEGRLLGLGKEAVGVTVEHHFAYFAHRNEGFGDELGRVHDVEAEGVLVLLVDDLHAELVFRVIASLDGLPEIAAMEVRVAPGDELGFVPDKRGLAVHGFPMETDEA